MLPDRVSNPGPLTYESGALPIALRGQVITSQRSIAPPHPPPSPHAPLMPGFLIIMKNQSRKLKSVMVSEQTDQNIVTFFSFLDFQGFTAFIRQD